MVDILILCCRFTCSRPHYAIKVGRGLHWGVMANVTTSLEGEQCQYHVQDCYKHETDHPFIDVSGEN